MKAWLRVFLFLLSFQLEVRVKASDVVLEAPEHCLQSQKKCSIKVREAAFHHENEKNKIHAVKDSVLERYEGSRWKLMQGQVWIEAGSKMIFETAYGTIQATQGEYWISVKAERVLVQNISSDLEVTLRDGQKVQAPAGFQFWIAGLNSQARSEYGMIEPINMKDLLPVWNGLFKEGKKSFLAKMQSLRESWGNLTEKSSAIYRDQALRKIASIEDQKKAEAEKRRKAQAAKEQLRELYHSRVFDR